METTTFCFNYWLAMAIYKSILLAQHVFDSYDWLKSQIFYQIKHQVEVWGKCAIKDFNVHSAVYTQTKFNHFTPPLLLQVAHFLLRIRL